jgi:hypothetical protein
MQGVKIKRRKLKGASDDTVVLEVEEVEYKFPDKNAAIEKLCKHLGLTKDGAGLEALVELIRERDGVL